jgi:hypothetical protein
MEFNKGLYIVDHHHGHERCSMQIMDCLRGIKCERKRKKEEGKSDGMEM